MITVTCQRIVGDEQQCGETAEIGMADNSSWNPTTRTRSSADIEVYLPDGWAADYVGTDAVIHCPAHAQ